MIKHRLFPLICLLIIKTVIHFFIIDSQYSLHRDEFLHLDQGKHLAWGYLSVPPFTSWLAFIVNLLGGSDIIVNDLPVLFGLLTLIVVWSIIEELGGGIFAQFLAGVALIFSALLRINMLFQPNAADIFFWSLCFFFAIKYARSESPGWLYLLSTSFALGFLNKYSIVFLLVSMLSALLFTSHRKIFLSKHFYLALFLALFLISPNILWQYEHGWPVIWHMQLLSKTQLSNVTITDFLKDQILFFIGSLFVWITPLFSLPRKAGKKELRFVTYTFVFCIVLFLWFKGKSYYAISLYPVLFALGSVRLEELTVEKNRRWIRAMMIALPVLLFIPIIQLAFPVRSPQWIAANTGKFEALGLLRWEDGKNHSLPQDFADMLGWKELADLVDQAVDSLGGTDNLLVLCHNYGQAGAINHYSRNKNIKAVSFNADYINWFPFDRKLKNVVLVREFNEDDPERKEEKPLFNRIWKVGEITSEHARERGTSVWALEGAKINLETRLKIEIMEEAGSPLHIEHPF